MQITVDSDRFDQLQLCVLKEIISAIGEELRKSGVTEAHALNDLTGSIAFSVAAIIDGSRVAELDGQEIFPVLTFSAEHNGSDFIGADGGSWMHEYVFGALDEVLSNVGEA